MALVDFYQLVVLHKLSRRDAGVLFGYSPPSHMPATTPPSSRSPSVQPSTRFEPRTPDRSQNATYPIPHSTPLSTGTSVTQELEDEPRKYESAKYEEYIAEDLKRHRVFVDIDVFMKHVLHVPEDWKVLWGEAIRQIKHDTAFPTAHRDFTLQCGTRGAKGVFYKPLMDIANAIAGSSEKSQDEPVKPRTCARYFRNDPGFLPAELDQHRLLDISLTWAQPLQVLEVKPFDCILVDGSHMPRLKANGRDPRESHAHPPTPSRFPKKKTKRTLVTSGESTTSEADTSATEPSSSRKRPAKYSSGANKSRKLFHESTQSGTSSQVATRSTGSPRTGETLRQKEVYLQVARYLFEKISIPAFRSHATIGLVDRDRVQFYHANHSVILVSSAINFSGSDGTDGGLDKFIAIMIAFNRLTLRDSGILHNLHSGRLFRNNENLPILAASDFPDGAVNMQEGRVLKFGGDKKTGPFALTCGKVISHEPSLIGRSTVVLHAKSSKWKGVDLVVKISWPSSKRTAEQRFLDKAMEVAKSADEHKWALNHLPRIFFAQEVDFASDSTHEKVASLFDNADFANGEYKYERRTLRIIIQERLYPLKTLTSEKDVAQVLLDAMCVHRWLYDHAKILHRDPSPGNIMYRVIEGRVHGVLLDYDLASWASSPTLDYTKTSNQRTGTPPYMAHALLDGTDPIHLYRHDVESFFYIMLILATHYEIRAPEESGDGGLRTRAGELCFKAWFETSDYNALAGSKSEFFTWFKPIDPSPSFKGFRGWLLDFQAVLNLGFRAKFDHCFLVGRMKDESVIPPFDDETLGGHITYSAIIGLVRRLTEELEGLSIRYDPSQTPPPASMDVEVLA